MCLRSRWTRTTARAGFDAFCEVYPRKEALEAAWRVWRKLQPDDDLTQRILAAVDWQRRQENWQRERGRFVPLPAKWLQDQRWTDEPPAIPGVSDATLRTLHAAAEFVKS